MQKSGADVWKSQNGRNDELYSRIPLARMISYYQ